MTLLPTEQPETPMQEVTTRAGDAVYCGEDRVIIGTALPDPPPRPVGQYSGQSPGVSWQERVEEGA